MSHFHNETLAPWVSLRRTVIIFEFSVGTGHQAGLLYTDSLAESSQNPVEWIVSFLVRQ